MFVWPGRNQPSTPQQPGTNPPSKSNPSKPQPTIPVNLGFRNGLLGVGVCAVLAARYFKKKLMLRPFQASVIVAWPTLGVAVMQTVIANSSPVQLEPVSGHPAASKDAQDSELAQRMKKLAEASKE